MSPRCSCLTSSGWCPSKFFRCDFYQNFNSMLLSSDCLCHLSSSAAEIQSPWCGWWNRCPYQPAGWLAGLSHIWHYRRKFLREEGFTRLQSWQHLRTVGIPVWCAVFGYSSVIKLWFDLYSNRKKSPPDNQTNLEKEQSWTPHVSWFYMSTDISEERCMAGP